MPVGGQFGLTCKQNFKNEVTVVDAAENFYMRVQKVFRSHGQACHFTSFSVCSINAREGPRNEPSGQRPIITLMVSLFVSSSVTRLELDWSRIVGRVL